MNDADFLAGLSLTPQGRAYIVSADGMLIAASDGTPASTDTERTRSAPGVA